MIGAGSPAALGGFAVEIDCATGAPRGSKAGAAVGQGIVAGAFIPAGALPPALPAAGLTSDACRERDQSRRAFSVMPRPWRGRSG
jgi:hypothetical protein